MKAGTLKLLVTASFLIIGVIGMSFFKQQPQQSNPKYSCTLTGQEWQTIITSIVSPDDFSNNQKKQISELIQKNLIAVDTTKKK